MKRVLFAVSLLVSVTSVFAVQLVHRKIYDFKYHNYKESTEILKQLASQYSELAKLYSIGKSATGKREIWCMEISNQKTGEAANKPAVYFDGNQHDIEVAGGEVTLYLAYYLLTNYGKDDDITNVIDTRVTYIIQRADPDGAEAYITGRVDWDVSDVPGATDADKDGKISEDGREDINGDGEIVKMRIEDPSGDWVCDQDDPRIMVRKSESDTASTFYRLINEGIDNDGDGMVNEDPPLTRFISNRNYPAFWSSVDGRFRGQGDYPLQEHNSRLLAEFIVSKPHISVLESYHTSGGIHLRPYGAKPDTDFPPQDLQDYQAILSRGTEITTYPVASVYNDFTIIEPDLPWEKQPDARHGVFIDWTYVHLGILSVTTELWTQEPILNEIGWANIPREKRFFAIPEQYNRPDAQVEILKWLDIHKNDPDLDGQGFIDWQPFKHPTLGDLEIGGFTKYWLFNPPPGVFLQKVVEDQVKFCVYRAGITPLVKIADVEISVTDDDEQLWEVTATVVNKGYLDTSTQQARNSEISKPDELTLKLFDEASTKDPHIVKFPYLHGTRGGAFISQYRNTWHIKAPMNSKVAIIISSEKGGVDKREIELR